MPHNVRSTRLCQQLVAVTDSLDKLSARFPGIARGSTNATIVDVDDPQERGRVRVIFDAMNPKDVPQVCGAGPEFYREGKSDMISHWLDVSPAFKGKQPPGLRGKRVHVNLCNNEYTYAVLQDVVYDPGSLNEDSAAKLAMPNNSTMTRLPVYPANNLPIPTAENLGCVVVEEGGPMGCDWMCVCLKRDGQYHWVRHADLAHGHAGADDGIQQVDSMGNAQSPVHMGTVGPNVFPCSHFQPKCNSSYSSRPTANPYGGYCLWSPPPMNKDLKADPGKDGPLVNPDPSKACSLLRGLSGFQDQFSSISSFSPAPSPPIPFLTQPGALDLLKKGQQALSLAQKGQQIIQDPKGFVIDQALSAAKRNIATPSSTTSTLGPVPEPIPAGAVEALKTAGTLNQSAQSALASTLSAKAAQAQATAEKYLPPGTLGALNNLSNPAGTLAGTGFNALVNNIKSSIAGGVLSAVQKAASTTLTNIFS